MKTATLFRFCWHKLLSNDFCSLSLLSYIAVDAVLQAGEPVCDGSTRALLRVYCSGWLVVQPPWGVTGVTFCTVFCFILFPALVKTPTCPDTVLALLQLSPFKMLSYFEVSHHLPARLIRLSLALVPCCFLPLCCFNLALIWQAKHMETVARICSGNSSAL